MCHPHLRLLHETENLTETESSDDNVWECVVTNDFEEGNTPILRIRRKKLLTTLYCHASPCSEDGGNYYSCLVLPKIRIAYSFSQERIEYANRNSIARKQNRNK